MAEPFFLPISVLMELGWVLRSVFGLSREEIAKVAAVVINLPTANVPSAENMRWAVERYAVGADWEDMIHIATSTTAIGFGSFEKQLAKQVGPNAPLPILSLNL